MTEEKLKRGITLLRKIEQLKLIPTPEPSQLGPALFIHPEYIDSEGHKAWLQAKIEALEKEFAEL